MHHTITLNLIVYLKKKLDARAFFFSHFDACTRTCCLLGRVTFVSTKVNNGSRPNVFPAGVANFGKDMYRLSPWSIKRMRFENWNFPRVKKMQNANITFYVFPFFSF